MKTDPRCLCTVCVIEKMEEAINKPIPDRIKLETIRMDFLNQIDYDKSINVEFTDNDLKLFTLFRDINCYDEKDEIISQIEMIKLYSDYNRKIDGKKSSFVRRSLGLPKYTISDNQKRVYKKLDSKKTIFDVKEIK